MMIIIVICCFFIGLRVTCKGSPGHGSRFVEDTVGEKMVSALLKNIVEFYLKTQNY